MTEKMSYVNTRSMGPMVQVDAGLQAQLAECDAKIRHHEGMVGEYVAWIQALKVLAEQHPNATRELNMVDWLYFFRTE